MKTRKLGRVLSLLLAVAMVVGLMIPAMSAMADEQNVYDIVIVSADKRSDGKEPWEQLRDALRDSNYGNNSQKPTRIKLEADVVVPKRGDATNPFNNTVAPYSCFQAIDQNNARNYVGYISRTNLSEDRWGRASYENHRLIVPYGKSFEIDLAGKKLSLSNEWQGFDPEKGTWYEGGAQGNQWTHDPSWPDDLKTDYGFASGKKTSDFSGNRGALSSVIYMKPHSNLVIDDTVGGGEITGGTGSFGKTNDTGKDLEPDELGNVALAGSVYQWVHRATKSGVDASGTVDGSTTETTYYYGKSGYEAFKGDYDKVCGGGVFVGAYATFTLNGGAIKRNTAYCNPKDMMINDSGDRYAMGGGVFVDIGGTFNMTGGSVEQNNARSYHTISSANNGARTFSQGGGVYLSAGATMNMTGGYVEENAGMLRHGTSSSFSDNNKENYAQGGGVYVGKDAVLNVEGGIDTPVSDRPSISANTLAAALVGANNYAVNGVWRRADVQGAGIYVAGKANLTRAVVVANCFPQAIHDDDVAAANNKIVEDKLNGKTNNGTISAGGVLDSRLMDGSYTVEMVRYDAEKQEAVYYGDTSKDTKDYPTPAKEYSHTSGSAHYGSVVKSVRSLVLTDGAGVYLNNDYDDATGKFGAALNIGEKVRIYDNLDFVTMMDSLNFQDNDRLDYPVDTNDSQDNVCLPTVNGHTQYIGCAAPATESKIGINVTQRSFSEQGTWGGAKRRWKVTEASGTGSTYTVVKSATPEALMGTHMWDNFEGYNPLRSDVQYFWDDGGNNCNSNTLYAFEKRAVIFNNGGTEGHPEDDFLQFGDRTKAYNSTTDRFLGYIMLNFNESNRHGYYDTARAYKWKETTNPTPNEFNRDSTEIWSIDLYKPNYAWYITQRNADGSPNYDMSKYANTSAYATNRANNGKDTSDTQTDLYFKAWHFYAPYSENSNNNNNKYFDFIGKDDTFKGNDMSLEQRADFSDKDLFDWNPNYLHQTVPTYTATWYTQDELAAARKDLSSVKAFLFVDTDGRIYIRLVSLVGGEIVGGKVAPTGGNANSEKYNQLGYVASTLNATPTLEGGYRGTTHYEANVGRKFQVRTVRKDEAGNVVKVNGKPAYDVQFSINADAPQYAEWQSWKTQYEHANVFTTEKDANGKVVWKQDTSHAVSVMYATIDTQCYAVKPSNAKAYDKDGNLVAIYNEDGTLNSNATTPIFVTPYADVSDLNGSHLRYLYGDSKALTIEALAQSLAADSGALDPNNY